MIIIRRRSFSPIRTAAGLAENTSARDPVKKRARGEEGKKKKREGKTPQRVCDDVLEKGAHECRHAIIRQTCGRDDSFETTEAVKTEGPFLTFIR